MSQEIELKKCRCGRFPNSGVVFGLYPGMYTYRLFCKPCKKSIACDRYLLSEATRFVEKAWNNGYYKREYNAKYVENKEK